MTEDVRALARSSSVQIHRGSAKSRPAFSVIVPCFNEEHSIRKTVQGLRSALRGQPNFELIIVDDGSTDESANILKEVVADDPELTVATHQRNQGYGAALKTGIRHATSEIIVITDADGTYPNERIPELVSLSAHYDMVVGSRTGDNVNYPVIRSIPKVFLKAYASWLAGTSIPDINSGMRIFRRDVAERFLGILPDTFSFTTTITLALLTNHYRVFFLPISYAVRTGKSKIKPVRDTLRFVQLIVRTGIYFAPLRVFSPFIVILSLGFIISFIYDVFVLVDLTERTMLLFMSTLSTTFFALLADMIDKRSNN
jgi:glycosyltransferase involved in cell wall biosynthesis